MTETGFRDFFKLSNFYFSCIGMVPYDMDSSPNPYLMLFIFWVELLPLFYFGVNFFYDVSLLLKAGDIECFVTLASYFGFLLESVVKMFYVRRRKEHLNSLIGDLQEIYPKSVWQERRMNAAFYLRRSRYIGRFYGIYFMMHIWIFNLYALAEYLIFDWWLGKRTVGMLLPYSVHMPFDYSRTFVYSFLYCMQCLCGFMAACSQVAPDLLVCAVTSHLIMHCENISREMAEYQPKGTDDEDLQFLKNIVVYHQKIYRLVDKMNETFDMPILFNFFASVFVICFIGFQITQSGKMDLVFKLVLYLVGSILQVYLISWYSEELISASTGISDAIYEQQWHAGSVRYKKMLILIMKRSQLPAQIRGGIFIKISRRTVTELLQISYKFFAMLRTMYDN